jgi:glucose/mannose-6-phosphate isomerase
VVAITSGGALGAVASRHGLPCVTLPAGLMPRMALGLLVFPALGALAAAGVAVASDRDLDEALEVITAQAADLGADTLTDKNEAKRLALALGGRLPAVYGGPLTGTAAYRWKTDLEENAKVLAVAGAVPEMNHNEIEIWRGPGARGLHAVLLREDGEPAEIARRFTLLRELLDPAAGGVSEAWARGRGRLARLLSLVQLGQWVSYYLAMLHETDPWPVPMLTEVKRRLGDGGGDRGRPSP